MRSLAAVLAGLMLLGPGLMLSSRGPAAAAEPQPAAAPAADGALPYVTIAAPEPRYAAPTVRDRLGRIWVPVMINDRGPYRLVLDTGASNSAIIAGVAADLHLPPMGASGVLLHGVTGSATVAAVRADSLVVGDLELREQMLPIVPDAMGGAQGVLGMEGMADKRIFIDFVHDRVSIMRSHGKRAAPGFITIPVRIDDNGLLRTEIYIGGVRAQAIIDTGGQVSVANLALKQALLRRRSRDGFVDVAITGATDDEQAGQSSLMPPIQLGRALIRGASITFGDMRIFRVWNMTTTPTLLIGMDTLGLVDTLIIDYRRHEVQLQLRQ